MEQINHQIQLLNVTVATGCHVDASITHSPRKPKTRAAYEVVSDREERDDETDAQTSMRVIAVTQPGVDIEARWVKKGGQSVFGYKQHTLVDHNGLVMAVETTAGHPFARYYRRHQPRHKHTAFCSGRRGSSPNNPVPIPTLNAQSWQMTIPAHPGPTSVSASRQNPLLKCLSDITKVEIPQCFGCVSSMAVSNCC